MSVAVWSITKLSCKVGMKSVSAALQPFSIMIPYTMCMCNPALLYSVCATVQYWMPYLTISVLGLSVVFHDKVTRTQQGNLLGALLRCA